jgi:hypothetical protein
VRPKLELAATLLPAFYHRRSFFQPGELSGGFWAGGPTLALCFVNFEHFAQFAMYWLYAPCDAGNDWCYGADLDYLGDVDLEDVKVLAYWWLSECPVGWPWE